MPSRKPLIAANWKMHPAPEDFAAYRSQKTVDAVVFPTFLDLGRCLEENLAVGAQFGHPSATGAHTGDVSMKMLADAGCSYVLCGHSERRKYHCETNAYIGEQVASALKHRLHPILCIGETEKEREEGHGKEVVQEQLEIAYARAGSAEITIAYEPVWAISGGDPKKAAATPADAEEMHAFIRTLLPKEVRETTRILYGGSMKPENAAGLLAMPNIDGGLVGGASLDPKAFAEIVRIAAKS